MNGQVKTAVAKVAVCGICAAGLALVYIYGRGYNAAVYYIAMVAFMAIAVAYAAIDSQKYPHISRTTLVAAVTLALCAGAYIVYFVTGLNARFTDFDALRSFIFSGGYWGFAVFIGLTIFQVVVLPVPAALTIVLGTAIYGPTVSFILSTIGTVIGSVISFMLGKVFGRRLCNWMFGEEKTEKYARLVGEKGRFLFIIMLLFPAFPDDMLCMVAGITSMSYGYFIVVCVLTRPVMIGLTAYLGSGAIPFRGYGIAIWVAIGCLFLAVFVIITAVRGNIEKRISGK